ncbi:MAG TPA: biotin carboxylase N-terminal domain-containing protein [Stellaceae bacterium]|nr:biotin carboxylase N-terminal domain-containing protein [Stellaceae bacterium]
MRKILIANRGEIACRIIRAARKLGLGLVAVHSEADRDSLHVALADEAVAIGPAPARESYLMAEKLLAAARASGADAIHPGYGFLSENADFAAMVIAAGLTWIGPSPRAIADMGDKERARRLARAAGVPVLEGSERFLPTDLSALAAAGQQVGFPLLVKAAAGGGGIGMRRVDAPASLHDAVVSTQGLAEKSFGDASIYLEHLVDPARHIEVQIFGLGDGRAVHLFERECSIQRRFQKIIEESPAPGLSAATRQAMAKAAVALASAQAYAGAGTVEFVTDAVGNFYFLEMNTRIQVEHPVTEMITGIDLVEAQLRLVRGEMVLDRQTSIERQGHAIECRIYAENPSKNFLPSPGPLTLFQPPPLDATLRLDTGFRQGDRITFHYDPMIAKLIAHGADRAQAIARMAVGLAAFRIEGVATNLTFLGRILDHPAFRAGEISTGYVAQYRDELLQGG